MRRSKGVVFAALVLFVGACSAGHEEPPVVMINDVTTAAPSHAPPALAPGASASAAVDGPHIAHDDERLAKARMYIASITLKAVEAYQRERVPRVSTAKPMTVSQMLCKSALPVPVSVPTGGETVEIPKVAFEGSDDEVGWRCLGFSVRATQFRYTYNAGSGYLGPARGGVDPGPRGFEVCAEADLVPGGVTTIACDTGQVVTERDSEQLRTTRIPFEALE